MAQIDEQAARKELEEAARLRERAEQLVQIAGELEQQAEGREQEAMDLIAPANPPSSAPPNRR